MSGDAVTPVTILGRTYRLRGADDPAYLSELAELVDGKMREIENATGTADTLKVAILASLNIADDYLKATRELESGGRGRKPAASGKVQKTRLARLVTLLDEALVE
jgi:cell division protein ZapA